MPRLGLGTESLLHSENGEIDHLMAAGAESQQNRIYHISLFHPSIKSILGMLFGEKVARVAQEYKWLDVSAHATHLCGRGLAKKTETEGSDERHFEVVSGGVGSVGWVEYHDGNGMLKTEKVEKSSSAHREPNRFPSKLYD